MSSKDLAKDVMAKDLAEAMSRWAMRRVFSCSARERRRLSLSVLISSCRVSSLDGGGGDDVSSVFSVASVDSAVSVSSLAVGDSSAAVDSVLSSGLLLKLRRCNDASCEIIPK